MTRDEIFAKVRDVLVDTLAVDEDEIAADTRLTTDLGAEVGSSRVDLQACKLEYSIVSPK